ncbi:MAG: sporulation initiation factor Spo0A C-terminal domain-containing protein [Oscillospiraceae bacterium]|jgi:two-component system response regulator (stage 0 sporulation protein A)|nr:sporulation initiation factor Spo0A C-terminal domain-containing protein [Oscillospiraceae bacterium]
MINSNKTSYTVNGATDKTVAVSKMLHELGVPVHHRGYALLRDAIVLVSEDPSLLTGFVKQVYPKLADSGDISARAAERAIGRAIDVAWHRCDDTVKNKYFSNAVFSNGIKPSIKEFVKYVVANLRA